MIADESRDRNASTVHIVPRGRLWSVVRESGNPENAETFSDLGRALDEATAGPVLVRVIVHERDSAAGAA